MHSNGPRPVKRGNDDNAADDHDGLMEIEVEMVMGVEVERVLEIEMEVEIVLEIEMEVEMVM